MIPPPGRLRKTQLAGLHSGGGKVRNMDFTIDPNETAGAFLARGGVIRGVTDGNPDPWNLPPDSLVGTW